MDKLTPKDTSKGAEEIVLTQIKQDFIIPPFLIQYHGRIRMFYYQMLKLCLFCLMLVT